MEFFSVLIFCFVVFFFIGPKHDYLNSFSCFKFFSVYFRFSETAILVFCPWVCMFMKCMTNICVLISLLDPGPWQQRSHAKPGFSTMKTYTYRLIKKYILRFLIIQKRALKVFFLYKWHWSWNFHHMLSVRFKMHLIFFFILRSKLLPLILHKDFEKGSS